MKYCFNQQDIDAIVDQKYKEALIAVGEKRGQLTFVPLDKLKEVWAIYRPKKLRELPGGCCGGTIDEPKKIEASVTDMIGTVAQAGLETAKRIFTGKAAFCSAEEEEARMVICRKCPHYIAESNRCAKCGCFLKAKTKLKAIACPIRLWNAIA